MTDLGQALTNLDLYTQVPDRTVVPRTKIILLKSS